MESKSELQPNIEPNIEKVSISTRVINMTHKLWGLMPYFIRSFFSGIYRRIDRSQKRLRFEFSQLTFSQLCYFVAIILFFTIVEEDDFGESKNTAWVGLIAGIGLMRELWSLFHRIWQKTLGKGVLLVLYAATANFALAISALKINNIAGVEPTPFIFTLGFTTLTMLPFWIIMASLIFFAIALVVQTTWLVVGLLLRIVRIKIRMHWEDEGFAVLTIIFRLILTPVVIVALTQTARPYLDQFNFMTSLDLFDVDDSRIQVGSRDTSGPVVQLFGQPSDMVQEIIEQAKAEELARERARSASSSEESDTIDIMEDVERQRHLDQLISALPYFKALSAINVPLNFSVTGPDHVAEIVNDGPISLDDESHTIVTDSESPEGDIDLIQASDIAGSQAIDKAEQSEESRGLDRLIAAFIFNFETYPNSMCKKKSSQHSLVIDENSVLLVEKSDTELGYTFTVEECVHVYKDN
jgi:hypothetical protein